MRKSRMLHAVIVGLLLSILASSSFAANCVISGRVTDYRGVPISGVQVRWTWDRTPSLTDCDGFFSLSVTSGQAGTLACAALPWSCAPASRYITPVDAQIPGQDFIVDANIINITGRLTNTRGQPLFGIAITGGYDVLCPSSASDGRYAVSVDVGWSGVISTYHRLRHFEPDSVTCTNLQSDLPDQDFVSPADLELYPTDYLSLGANLFTRAAKDLSDGEELILHPGTYRSADYGELSFWGKAITIRSTEPDNAAVVASTIVDAEGNNRCVGTGGVEGPDSVLAGLTLRRGSNRGILPASGAIECYSSPTIRNCVVKETTSIPAVYVSGGSPTISNCTFLNNQGPVARLSGSSAVFENCILKMNRESCGLIIAVNGGSPVFANCLIAENDIRYALGSYMSSSHVAMRNCTIANNSCIAGQLEYGGLFSLSSASLELSSSILFNSSQPAIPLFYLSTDSFNGGPSSSLMLEYTNCPNTSSTIKKATPDQVVTWGPGCISGNPLFAVDANDGGDGWRDSSYVATGVSANNVYGDYHLKSAAGRFDPALGMWVKDSVTSPCIDAGDPSASWAGETWPNGSRIDMGAYGGTPQASFSPDPAMAAADLSDDGIIDNRDLLILAEAWLSTASSPADLNADGAVNFLDYLRLANAYMLAP